MLKVWFGAKRIFLKLHFDLAPIKVAIFPLQKNKIELTEKAREIYKNLQNKLRVEYDDTGSIGKRYRRQDEVGTPYCICVDYQTLEDETVTVRDRDTMEQRREKITDLAKLCVISF
jgi:glycyl-tRNA synthetase